MLEMIDIGVAQAVAYRLVGKINKDDMTQVFDAIHEKVEQFGAAYIYQEIDAYTGVEFAAMLEKIKFLFENGLANISRVAVVTDKSWLQKIVALEDKLFKNIDLQCFVQQDKKLAVEFLKEHKQK